MHLFDFMTTLPKDNQSNVKLELYYLRCVLKRELSVATAAYRNKEGGDYELRNTR